MNAVVYTGKGTVLVKEEGEGMVFRDEVLF